MRHDRDPYRDHQYVPDTFWLVAAALLFAACGLVWLIGQVAAIVFGAHEHLPVRLVDMLGVLLQLPGSWDDPARAWPPSSQPLLPGPVGMYAAAVLTFWLPALCYGLLVRLLSPRARRRRKQHGARWASWWQLRRLLVVGPRRGRIILGRRDRIRDRLLGRLYLAVEQCHSVLAFGPPGSFKTHGLVIPSILEWQGNLVTTSIKPDVLRATCAHRANLGAVWVYDPLGLSGVPGARWTPLAYCRTYADARRIGRMLADAADVQGHKADDANYWQLLGAKLLSVLLFAAAGTGRSMADVARWVDVQDVDDVAQALMEIGNQQALDAWAACTSRPDNTMGSVYGTAETLLDVFGDPVIAQSAEGCDLDLDELLTGANNTLYLYAPASEQERLRPLFELLVSVVIYKAEQLAAAQPNGMLDPRLFVCLDEAGNCAAIKKLPQLATTGRGQGIQLLTIWHDEAQLQHRYGHRASTVLNGHRAKLLLSGQADPASLELASKLVGDEAVTQTSETTGGDGRASTTESTAYRRLLPPEALPAQTPPGAAAVWASAAGADPPATLVPQPPSGHPRHGGGCRVPASGHAGRRRPRPHPTAPPGRRRWGGGRLMGTFLDDLDDHEGYPDRRLPNGQLAGGVWTYATREFTAYVAVCGCGWQASGEHPPTEDGEEAAIDQWRSEHATPELARQTTRRRGTLGLELRWLGTQADRLQDPATLKAVSRALDHAGQLVTDLQRELERSAPQREADGER